MALMLRKACQVELDKVGMSQFYADINNNSKGLTLHNICGAIFAPVHGVNFSRNDVTRDEITFAVQLLEIWLKRNALKIKNCLAAQEVLKNMKEPDKSFLIKGWKVCLTIHTEGYYHENGQRMQNYTIKSSIQKYGLTFYFNGKHHLTTVSIEKAMAIWNGKLTVPTPVLSTLFTAADRMHLYYLNKKIVEDTKADLNSCCST